MSSLPLDTPVLVLNRNYSAVHMVTCRRALTLLYKATAEVVHVQEEAYDSHGFDDWVIRSAGLYLEGGFSSRPLDEKNSDDSTEDWVFTVAYPVQVPRIIRLLRYDRYPRRRIPLTRRNVFARDEYSCQYCGVRGGLGGLTIDHVVPRSRGGRETWANIVTACARCNHRKGMRNVAEAGMKLRKTPRAPKLNPVLEMNLRSRKFECWRKFV